MPRKSKASTASTASSLIKNDCHSIFSDNSDISNNTIKKEDGKEWFVAIDPGKVNFAFIIEEIDPDMIHEIEKKCPPKKQRFSTINNQNSVGKRKKRENLEPTEPYIQFLEQFYHCGKTVLCSNNNIEDNDNKEKGKGSRSLSANVFLKLTEILDGYRPYFDQCSTIIIEQQMSYGSKINTMAIKIAQHTYSYFLFRYGNTKKIIEFPSYNKTQILGAPGGLEKPQRKKWAIEKADEIWTLRGDMETSEFVKSKKKKDDMSDCLLHVLSYMICNYFE